MENINIALWRARILALMADCVLFIAYIVVSAFFSPDFINGVINPNLGEGTMTALVVGILIKEGGSHIWNIKTLKKAKEKFGAYGAPQEPIVLI